MMKLTAAAAVLALAGCATQDSGPPSAEELAAYHTLQRCHAAGAADIDDGVSDARTVAQSVMARCRQEFQYFESLAAGGSFGAYREGMLVGLARLGRDDALEAVFAARRINRR